MGLTQSGTVEVVNLTRTSQGRIGLLIKEGDDHKIYVEDVVPGEPAVTQGDLRQGDRILEACISYLSMPTLRCLGKALSDFHDSPLSCFVRRI